MLTVLEVRTSHRLVPPPKAPPQRRKCSFGIFSHFRINRASPACRHSGCPYMHIGGVCTALPVDLDRPSVNSNLVGLTATGMAACRDGAPRPSTFTSCASHASSRTVLICSTRVKFTRPVKYSIAVSRLLLKDCNTPFTHHITIRYSRLTMHFEV